MAGPLIGSGEGKYFPPMLQIGNDFKCFGYFSTSIFGENLPNLSIDSLDFRIVDRFLINFLQFPLKHFLPIHMSILPINSKDIHQIDLCIDGLPIILLGVSHLDNLLIFDLLQLSPDVSGLGLFGGSLGFFLIDGFMDPGYPFTLFLSFGENSLFLLLFALLDSHC